MSLTDSTWTERLVTANGIRQHVWRTGGNRPPVICLPGFSEIGLTYARVARALADRFDVIMVDFRGQGRTEVGDVYDQDTLTRDVAALIAALGLDRVAVLGFSNGGGVAAQLGAEHPDRVRCLVLEDRSVVMLGKEPILHGATVVGYVTSANFGYTVGQSIAYGYLPLELAGEGIRLEIQYFGRRYPATVGKEPLYDPDMSRLKELPAMAASGGTR